VRLEVLADAPVDLRRRRSADAGSARRRAPAPGARRRRRRAGPAARGPRARGGPAAARASGPRRARARASGGSRAAAGARHLADVELRLARRRDALGVARARHPAAGAPPRRAAAASGAGGRLLKRSVIISISMRAFSSCALGAGAAPPENHEVIL